MEGLAALSVSAFSSVSAWLPGLDMSLQAATPLLPAEQLMISGH